MSYSINVLTGKEIYSIESNEPVVFVNDVYDESLSKVYSMEILIILQTLKMT